MFGREKRPKKPTIHELTREAEKTAREVDTSKAYELVADLWHRRLGLAAYVGESSFCHAQITYWSTKALLRK